MSTCINCYHDVFISYKDNSVKHFYRNRSLYSNNENYKCTRNMCGCITPMIKQEIIEKIMKSR